MIAGHRPALGTVLGTVLCATLPAQDPAQDPAQNEVPATAAKPALQKSPFLDGWLIELLEGDAIAARQRYERVANDRSAPAAQSELAMVRLREGSLDLATRAKHRDALAARNVYDRPARTRHLTAIADLATKAKSALDQHDGGKLIELRKQLRELVQRSQSYDPRRLLKTRIKALRDPGQTDSVLADLERRFRAAIASNDRKAANQLMRSIRRRRFSRLGPTLRIQAGRWAEVTRLHLAGEHERAARMEGLLGLDARRLTRSGRQQTAQNLLDKIRTWDRLTQRARLEGLVMPNLKRMLGWRWSAREHAVLQQLQGRLEQLIAEGRRQDALQLAAHVPYRVRLFQ